MPPIFGLLTSLTTIAIFPAYLGLFLVLMLAVTERLNRLAAYPVCSQPLRS